MKTYLIAISALCVFFSIGCKPKECRTFSSYRFYLPVTFSTQSDLLHVGDTLTVSTNFADDMYAYNRDEYYTMEDIIFGYGFRVFRLDSSALLNPSGFNNFIYYSDSLLKHEFFPGWDGMPWLRIIPTYSNHNYHFTFDMIAQKPGCYYLMTFLPMDEPFYPYFENKICDGGTYFKPQRANAGDGNGYLLENSYYEDWYIHYKEDHRIFDEHAGYCFCVEE